MERPTAVIEVTVHDCRECLNRDDPRAVQGPTTPPLVDQKQLLVWQVPLKKHYRLKNEGLKYVLYLLDKQSGHLMWSSISLKDKESFKKLLHPDGDSKNIAKF